MDCNEPDSVVAVTVVLVAVRLTQGGSGDAFTSSCCTWLPLRRRKRDGVRCVKPFLIRATASKPLFWALSSLARACVRRIWRCMVTAAISSLSKRASLASCLSSFAACRRASFAHRQLCSMSCCRRRALPRLHSSRSLRHCAVSARAHLAFVAAKLELSAAAGFEPRPTHACSAATSRSASVRDGL